MSQMFFTCDPVNLTIEPTGEILCTAWEMREVIFPMYELDNTELTALMGAVLGFFALCAIGKRLFRAAPD